MIDYKRFTTEVQQFDFIPEEQTADAAVKAVLGICASRMEDSEARQFTGELPDPLSFETLRSHQERPVPVSTNVAVAEIATQFDLTNDQATRLVERVVNLARESLDDATRETLVKQLPADWGALLQAG